MKSLNISMFYERKKVNLVCNNMKVSKWWLHFIFQWTITVLLRNMHVVFPIDTPLVLRLVKTHMGKCLFSPELKSYLITQWNCTTIGSCRCRKTNQWVGSGAARTYGDDTRQYSRRNGRGIWLYKRSFRHRILRFFLLQRRRLRLRWSREAYSPLTRLAVGPSDLDLLGWSAFNAPQHRSSSGPVRCRYPAIT